MDITYNGKNYFIERNEEENDNSLYNRMMFISKQNPNTDEDFKKFTRLSNIWINKILLGCAYSSKIENTISEYSKLL